MDACGLTIPVELWELVLRHLSWPQYARLRGLSRAWRRLLDDPALWRDAPLRERFARCCTRGRLHAAQWIAARVGLSALNADAGAILAGACSRGHADVARWVCAAFGLTAASAGAGALRVACAEGYLDVVRWLAGPGRPR